MRKTRIFIISAIIAFGVTSFSFSGGGDEKQKAECPYLQKLKEQKVECPYKGDRSGNPSECPFLNKDGKTKGSGASKQLRIIST